MTTQPLPNPFTTLTRKHTPSFRFDNAPGALDVALDLDGCFFGFDRNYYDAAIKLGRIPLKVGYRPAQTWNFYEDLYGQTGSDFAATCHEAVDQGLLFMHGYEMDGGRRGWSALRSAGHRIHVKTARSFGVHPIASQVATYGWLDGGGYLYESITFTHDKTAGPRADIMLEDNLENYDALDAAGVEVWLFNQPWNQDDGTRRRVYNHAEFVTRVDALARRGDEERAVAARVDRLRLAQVES